MHGTGATRLRTARVLFVLAGLALVVAVVAGYAWRAVGNSDQASRRAVSAVQDPDVRRVVGERAADALIGAHPDLIAGRALIASAIAGAVGTDAFAAMVRGAVRDAHAAVFRREANTVTFTLADLGVVAGVGLQVAAPDLAREVEQSRPIALWRERSGAVEAAAATARRLGAIAVLATVLAVLAGAAAMVVRRDARAAVAALGWTLAAAGAAVIVLELVGGAVVPRLVPADDARTAAVAVWNAFVGDLRSLGWLLLACGAIAVAAVTTRLPTDAVDGALRRAWQAARHTPASRAGRALRGVGLLGLGIVVFAAPLATATLAVRLGALYLGYKGLEALLGLVEPEAAGRARAPERTRPPRPRTGARLLVPAFAVTGALALAVVLLRPDHAVSEPAAAPVTACNGHAELCGRSLPEIALPATHNSMSVPLPGWSAALQERPIDRQLDDGIRGLLIDTHYGDRLAGGRVRTAFGSPADLTAALRDDPVGQAALAAGKRLRERIGFRGEGKRGVYLCHTFCELGATPLRDVLEDIRAFLVMHPGEVVVIVNQDHVTPADFVAAMDAAGLSHFALVPPESGRWPTLREMIDRDRRLVVLAENEAGRARWYRLAYARLMAETPFSFGRPQELLAPDRLAASCRAERGPEGAPLFLLNHWINTDPAPRPSNAAQVNTPAAIEARVRACERARGRTPNLVAVDFYRRGDVFGAVDELNGL